MRTEDPRTVLGGRYLLEEELGRSDAGVSWRATDTVLDRSVVVKLVRPGLADDPSFGPRLEEAARAVAAVSHKGLARLLDTGAQDGVPYVVRELAEGESLRAVLEREGRLDPARAAGIVADVLDAVEELQRRGVPHLGLKPENAIVAHDGSVRVCDAAIAAIATGRTGDRATDVRDAAALLFEVVTGHAPVGGETSVRAVRPDAPRGLDALVAGTLAEGASPPSAAELAGSLRAIAGAGSRTLDHAQRSGHQPGSRWFRTWFAVPLAVAAIAATAVAAGLWMGRLELGGPVGVRITEEEPEPPSPAALRVVAIRTLDPFGDRVENDDAVGLAADGNLSTAWRSENYFDGSLRKPGVGLVLDLGEERTVTGFRLWTPSPGFSFAVLVGNDPEALTEAAPRPSFVATADLRETLEPAPGRYVLLWFNSVVPTGDGNRIEVAELKVFGT